MIDAKPNVDPREVAQFDALARRWWDPDGPMRPLHRLGPARMAYLRDTIAGHFGPGYGYGGTGPSGAGRFGTGRAAEGGSDTRAVPLAGLTILDVGCGGGLVAEPLARMGARVTGLDPGAETIAAARAHAVDQGLSIDYRVGRVEDVAAAGERFDVVTCLEVVEHVPDVAGFVRAAATAVRPGGLLVASTINRTLRSYALAIVAAEYVLGWLPRGTHDWNRFVTPDELAIYMRRAGLERPRTTGLVLDPLADVWRLSADTGVNYFAAAAKPVA
jgi:2-polyprenyl-6-hydroxyphenyl methylase/3-demethylubiquinone-9 3-methyltransferase